MADTNREFERYMSDLGEATNPAGDGVYQSPRIRRRFDDFRAGFDAARALASRPAEVDDWIKLSEQEPEVGETVLVFSEIWGSSRVLRFRVQPWKSFLDADQGRWFWNLETMLWKRFSAPSHTTNKEK